jgi:hypothetical protein
METNVEKILNDFVGTSETIEELEEKEKINTTKKVILDEREGIIERVDKILITKDGKQLLREVY